MYSEELFLKGAFLRYKFGFLSWGLIFEILQYTYIEFRLPGFQSFIYFGCFFWTQIILDKCKVRARDRECVCFIILSQVGRMTKQSQPRAIMDYGSCRN